MSDADSRGPQVAPAEDLYRAIHVPDWWDHRVDPPRVRSFAFKVDSPFSVNVASMIGLDGAIHHLQQVLHCPEGGIVCFNTGVARSFGFDARHERDPDYPDNEAHAHVYYDGSPSSRKRAAKSLAEKCRTAHPPSR
jgi:hypothetical protein